ncbi:MAG: hypothetical protein V1869_03470 [Candidatus Omnitrophota bacterium]
MGLLNRLLGVKVIHSPRLGILNLIGKDAESLIVDDRAALENYFSSVELSDKNIPLCDTLLIYAQIEPDGKIKDSQNSFREIIMHSKASVVIVATENEGKNYLEAAKKTGYGQANFVLTLKRNGKAFAEFFSEIFRQMHKGIPMSKAWIKLAPQGGKANYENCPDAMLTCELGQITFSKDN